MGCRRKRRGDQTPDGKKMDPRGFTVNTTAAPNDYEKAHHYLWRFWKNVPKKGHVAVYDRTWYGRVMVERI